MSDSINQFGSSGASIYLNRAIDTLSSQESALEAETASGVITDSYSGLGNSTSKTLNLQTQANEVTAWQSNITTAQTTLTTTASTLSSIASISSALTTSLTELEGTGSQTQIAVIASSAKAALGTLQSLLNTQVGGSYILGGQNATTPVVPSETSLSNSSLASQISSVVSQLSTQGSDQVLASTLSLAADNDASVSPFSTSLSVTATDANSLSSQISVSQGALTSVGVVATAGEAATTTSTGSAIRDLMRNLMVVAALGSSDASSDEISSLAQGLLQSNTSVDKGLSTMQGQIGLAQNSLSTRATALTQISTSLTDRYSTLTSADLATVSTQLNQTQTQLEASYSLIADMKSLSLVNYI